MDSFCSSYVKMILNFWPILNGPDLPILSRVNPCAKALHAGAGTRLFMIHRYPYSLFFRHEQPFAPHGKSRKFRYVSLLPTPCFIPFARLFCPRKIPFTKSRNQSSCCISDVALLPFIPALSCNPRTYVIQLLFVF